MMNWFTDMSEATTTLFGEDFDVFDHTRPCAPQVEADKFTLADLAARQKKGWEEGFAAGLEAGLTDLQAGVQINISEIATEIRTAKAEFLTQAEHIADELAGLLLAAFGNILPTLCAQYGLAEISAVAAEILPSLGREPQLRIQVAPDRMASLRAILAQYDADLVQNISLLPASKLGPSDIVIRWHHGEAVRNADAMWRNILAILAPHGLNPAPTEMAATTKEPAHVQ